MDSPAHAGDWKVDGRGSRSTREGSSPAVVRVERAAAGGGLGPVAGHRGRLAARDSRRGARTP